MKTYLQFSFCEGQNEIHSLRSTYTDSLEQALNDFKCFLLLMGYQSSSINRAICELAYEIEEENGRNQQSDSTNSK